MSITNAKDLRRTMIDKEMDSILQAARSYVRTHLDEDDIEEEMITALRKAANNLSYRNKFYDVMKDEIVYLPTCSKLILSNDLIEEAEKHYYDDDDEFLPEYCKALRSVVFDTTVNRNDNVNASNDDPDDIDDNDELMERLATEWTEALETDDSSDVVDK